ncbi:hypothetical protein SDC9_62217 [bioreactor metagenome]|uniref:Uncharacterized protein n=1 Tax=bioreactor metagenome TaxID=1076179 RepID=A0A644XP33_9ZZZZ
MLLLFTWAIGLAEYFVTNGTSAGTGGLVHRLGRIGIDAFKLPLRLRRRGDARGRWRVRRRLRQFFRPAVKLALQLILNQAHVRADLRVGGNIPLNQIPEPERPAVLVGLLLYNGHKLPERLPCGFAGKLLILRALKGAQIHRVAIDRDQILYGGFVAHADPQYQFFEPHTPAPNYDNTSL